MITAAPGIFLGLGIGSTEVLLFLAVFLIFLGPRELPRIARTLGRISARLRRASDEFRDQVMNLDRPESGPTDGGARPSSDSPSPTASAREDALKNEHHEPAG